MKVKLYRDGSFLYTNILLSDPNYFEGGGTYFNNRTTTNLEEGDLLVHSGLKITKGTRYILVAFVSIIVNKPL
jgi:hypothetical protein